MSNESLKILLFKHIQEMLNQDCDNNIVLPDELKKEFLLWQKKFN